MLKKTPTLDVAFYLALIALFIGASLFSGGSASVMHLPLIAALWGMFVIRTAISEGPHSLIDTLRLFATIIAASAAIRWRPDSSLADIAQQAGLTALIIPAYLALIWAIPAQRPATWGLRFGLPFWVAALALIALSAWNFLFEMPTNQGLALIATLCCTVYFLNSAIPISNAKIPMPKNWRARIMASTSLPFGLYAVLSWPPIALGQASPVPALITTAITALVLFALSPWLDRSAANRRA
jgi:hypothetical protein